MPWPEHNDQPTLRFVTCGSVDDALASESKTAGTAGHNLDFALLMHGLQAEREQRITIDAAC